MQLYTIMEHHHIAVFAFPFGNHGSALLNIIRRLTSLAPQKNVHFSFFSTSSSIDALFPPGSDQSFPNIRSYKIWDGKPEGYDSKGNPLDEEIIDLFLMAGAGVGARAAALKAVVEKAEEEVGVTVRCIMSDSFLLYIGDLAKEIGFPWVPCWTSAEHSLSLHVYTDVIREKFGTQGIEGRENETLDFIPGLTKIRVKDIPDGIIMGSFDSLFSKMPNNMSQVLPFASAICINCCEELDPLVTNDLKSKFSKVFTIGPNLVTYPPKAPDTYNCLGWLHKQSPNSVVYLGFGTSATPTPNELFALAEALQDSKVKFLWSIKDHHKVHFPSGFLDNKENGMVVPWVPQIDVLAREAVGVFITHFGYNSMTESIVAEVPMIGRPFFGDHRLNGRLIEAVWEIGLQVDGGAFTKEGILKSLDRIISSDEGKKMKENLKSLNKLVEKGVAPTGSSNNNFKLLLEHIMKA